MEDMSSATVALAVPGFQEPYIQVVAGNQLLKLHRISDLLFDVSSGHLRLAQTRH